MKPTRDERVLLDRLGADEIRALDYFRARNGHAWKRKLQVIWENGGLESETNGDALQRVRNIIGPSGLHAIRGYVIAEVAKEGGGS